MTVTEIRIPVPARRAAPDPAVLAEARGLRLHRLLVPLDGSPPAEYALPFAGLTARWLESELTLFHSLQPMHPVRVGRPGHMPYPDAEHDRGSHLATSYLEEVAARLRPHDIAARWSVATGNVARMISNRAVAGGFGMVVIAGRPKPRLVRRVQPSVVDELWRLSAVPLMLINHARVAMGQADIHEPRAIFVPFDGSKTASAAIPLARVFSLAAGARLTLVVNRPEPKDGAIQGEHTLPDTALARTALETAEGLRAEGCDAGVESVADGETGVARRQIQERGSWVVAGSRMRSGLSRLVLGSRADSFLRQCRGPLVVVPDPGVALKRSKRAHRESLVAPEAAS